MPILVARQLAKSYGPLILLQDASLSLEQGDRVGLLGRNGSGKTTLARLLCGEEEPDAGEISLRRGAEVAYLPQNPRLEPELSAMATVLGGLGRWTEALDRHERLSGALQRGVGEQAALLAEQAAAAAEVERLGGWDLRHRAEAVLGQLGVARPEARVGQMSGGEQRRVALARLLLSAPDLAILDEPTNHLDVDTVEWLEQVLAESFAGAVLVITHDRWFLDRVVRRTLELDEGRLHAYAGGYEAFLEARAERLELQARSEANRQRYLRQELEWLRRAPKARTGKQKARIKRAEAALSVEAPREQRQAELGLSGVRQGKTILELRGLEVAVGGRALVQGLDFTLTRGQRVGIIGPNGCGKTTLLRTLIGQHPAAAGQITLGKNTRLSYLDQGRGELDLEASVLDNVSGGKPAVKVGERWVDIHPYLARFLFQGEALRQPVGSLSGGERTRVALARLLLQPANLVLLDEPTNDLDVPTLAALESMLLEFQGTALVVTHDRWFLDRVATGILAFEGEGRVVPHAGNYTTYRALRRQQASARARAEEAPKRAKAPPKKPRQKRALTYAERLELAAIEEKAEAAEERVAELEQKLADPTLYQKGGEGVPALIAELEQARAEAGAIMARWEELEEKKEAGEM